MMDEVDSCINNQIDRPTLNSVTESHQSDSPKMGDGNYVEDNQCESTNSNENGLSPPSPITMNGHSNKAPVPEQIILGEQVVYTSNNIISDAMNGDSQVYCDDQSHKPIRDSDDDNCDNNSHVQQLSIEVTSNANLKTSNGHLEHHETNGLITTNGITNGHVHTPTNMGSSIKKEDSFESTPFHLLAGEKLRHKREKLADGYLYLTNYRIFVQPSVDDEYKTYRNYPRHKMEQAINMPIGVVDSIETRDINLLIVFTKFVHSFTLKFESNDSTLLWFKRLNDIRDDDVFCFKFCESLTKKLSGDIGNEQLSELIARNKDEISFQKNDLTLVRREFKRMQFNLDDWRICELNKDFKFCNSYPRYFVVPKEINDKELECVGTFRYSKRIPVVVWRSQRNGCVIARSSQPVVGWLGWRNPQDERLLQNILRLCNQDTHDSYQQRQRLNMNTTMLHKISQNGNAVKENRGFAFQSNENALVNGYTTSTSDHNRLADGESMTTRKLLILDARSYAAAFANRAIGGGCECAEYYANCDVQFMCLNNIHTIRKSFYALRFICEPSQIDNYSWLTMLDGTKWLHYMSSLLRAAGIVVDAISIQERPVLVHCSDGWDRTPQVIALAQIMLDPYCRTLDGFRVLIEREFLQFGHKFADRCRSSTSNIDLHERCPVFLQFLDCVHQLISQFPTEFEFNALYLVKLAHHTYSCLFGTFQCNTFQERFTQHIYDRTLSIWAFFDIEKRKFENHENYFPTSELEILRPSNRVKDMIFWDDVYVPRANSTISSEWFELFITNRKSDSSTVSNDSSNESSEEFTCKKHKIGCKSISKCELNRSISFENLPSPQKKDPCECSNIVHSRHLSDSCLFDKDQKNEMCDFLIGGASLQVNNSVNGQALNGESSSDAVIEPVNFDAQLEADYKQIQDVEAQLDFHKKRCADLEAKKDELRRKVSFPDHFGQLHKSEKAQDLVNGQHSNALTTAIVTTSTKQIEALDLNMCNLNGKCSNGNINRIMSDDASDSGKLLDDHRPKSMAERY